MAVWLVEPAHFQQNWSARLKWCWSTDTRTVCAYCKHEVADEKWIPVLQLLPFAWLWKEKSFYPLSAAAVMKYKQELPLSFSKAGISAAGCKACCVFTRFWKEHCVAVTTGLTWYACLQAEKCSGLTQLALHTCINTVVCVSDGRKRAAKTQSVGQASAESIHSKRHHSSHNYSRIIFFSEHQRTNVTNRVSFDESYEYQFNWATVGLKRTAQAL